MIELSESSIKCHRLNSYMYFKCKCLVLTTITLCIPPILIDCLTYGIHTQRMAYVFFLEILMPNLYNVVQLRETKCSVIVIKYVTYFLWTVYHCIVVLSFRMYRMTISMKHWLILKVSLKKYMILLPSVNLSMSTVLMSPDIGRCM